MGDLELAELPTSGRLAIDGDAFVHNIVLYPAKVETEANAEGFCVRFLEGPYPVEAADCFRLWNVCEQGGQFERGELERRGEPRTRMEWGDVPDWRQSLRILEM